mmetsp:Transcript_9323/g.37794  ORF Transcript_9323/g.37794 Transcript_9323/m.37794 type:complete len:279 (-) Transcript_9323:58-894(-)
MDDGEPRDRGREAARIAGERRRHRRVRRVGRRGGGEEGGRGRPGAARGQKRGRARSGDSRSRPRRRRRRLQGAAQGRRRPAGQGEDPVRDARPAVPGAAVREGRRGGFVGHPSRRFGSGIRSDDARGERNVARGVPGGRPRVRADLPGDLREDVHRRLQRVPRSRALAGVRFVPFATGARRALRRGQRQRATVGGDAGPGRRQVPSRSSRRGVGLDAGVPRARGHRVDAAGDVAASMGDGRVRDAAIDGARGARVPREHEREVPGGVDRGAEERERRG